MTTEQKKAKIKLLVKDMLKDANRTMIQRIDTALNSGAVDVDGWDEKVAPMILPKCILTAILEHQATINNGSGTGYEKRIKKEVNNIRYYL